MKSRMGHELLVACFLATLFLALVFNGGGRTPSLYRTPIAVRSHNDVRNVKLTKEVFNTPSMSAPAPATAPSSTETTSTRLTLEQQDAVYSKFVVDVSNCIVGGDAIRVLGGVSVVRAFAFIEKYHDAGRISKKNFVERICQESGKDVGIGTLESMKLLATNPVEVKRILGETPDASIREILSQLHTLAQENLYEAMMMKPEAVEEIQVKLQAKLARARALPKSTPALDEMPHLSAGLKNDLIENVRNDLKLSNKKTEKIAEIVNEHVGQKNAQLHRTQQKVYYHKTKRAAEKSRVLTDFEKIAKFIEREAPLAFEGILEGTFVSVLPSKFVSSCRFVAGIGEELEADESVSFEFETSNADTAEEKAEVPPPPSNATSAATEPPATEASDFPPNGTDLNGGTAPPVEMDTVDADDDVSGIMTGVSTAFGGLMSSVFGTSDSQSSALIASSLDDGKKLFPAKNFEVGQTAKFGQYDLVVKSRSDGVHFWRRL